MCFRSLGLQCRASEGYELEVLGLGFKLEGL